MSSRVLLALFFSFPLAVSKYISNTRTQKDREAEARLKRMLAALSDTTPEGIAIDVVTFKPRASALVSNDTLRNAENFEQIAVVLLAVAVAIVAFVVGTAVVSRLRQRNSPRRHLPLLNNDVIV